MMVFPGPRNTILRPNISKLTIKDVPQEMQRGMFTVYLNLHVNQLTSICIYRCGLGDTGLMRLVIAIQNSRLNELFLRENGISAAGILILNNYVRKSKIVKLDLSYNHFGSEGVYLVLGMLRENPVLECLNINFNRVDFQEPIFGRHLESLLHTVMRQSKVICLELEGLGGDLDLWTRVLSSLGSNTYLQRLGLSRSLVKKLERTNEVPGNTILCSLGPTFHYPIGKGALANMLRKNHQLWAIQKWSPEKHYRMNESKHQMIITSLLCCKLPIELWKRVFGNWTNSML